MAGVRLPLCSLVGATLLLPSVAAPAAERPSPFSPRTELTRAHAAPLPFPAYPTLLSSHAAPNSILPSLSTPTTQLSRALHLRALP